MQSKVTSLRIQIELFNNGLIFKNRALHLLYIKFIVYKKKKKKFIKKLNIKK